MDSNANTSVSKIALTGGGTRTTSLSDEIQEPQPQFLIGEPDKEAASSTSSSSLIMRSEHPQEFPSTKIFRSTESLPDTIQGSWTKIARANMSVDLSADLVRIGRLPSNWGGPGSQSLRPKSLQNFLEFWLAIRDNAAEPEITLAPDGTLHAEWFKSPRQRLDVRFADQKAFFGLLTNNSILEGADDLGTVAGILKLHHARPLLWSAR